MKDLIIKKDGKEIINFPDANFKMYLIKNFDFDKDGEISVEDALQVKAITIVGKYYEGLSTPESLNIYSLEGIEYFQNLTTLSCKNNQLSSLDVSKNKHITFLSCDYNRELSDINTISCTELKRLNCNYTNLSKLDISTNTKLSELFCGCCKLTSLDITKNISLTYLSCYYNQLSTLDIFQNTLLEYLNTRHNDLTTLDISQNVRLKFLHCGDNELTSLDISNNKDLESLNYYLNPIKTVDTTHNMTLNKKHEEHMSNPNRIKLNTKF